MVSLLCSPVMPKMGRRGSSTLGSAVLQHLLGTGATMGNETGMVLDLREPTRLVER